MSPLTNYPPPERWDDWVELDAKAWAHGERRERRYRLDPDDLLQLRGVLRAAGLRRQGDRARSPSWRATRSTRPAAGRNCAKGPATINQVHDPERILYPLKRAGGAGRGAAGSASRGTRRSPRSAGGSAPRSARAATTRSSTTSAARATTATWSGCCTPGASTATTATPTSARPAAGVGYASWMGFDRPSGDYAERQGDLPHLGAPRGRPLLQPPRPADHGGQGARREGHLRRPAPVQHRVDERPLAGAVAGYRGGAAAGHRPAAAAARARGTASSCAAGSTGSTSCARPGPDLRPHVRQRRPGADRALRRVHARVRGARSAASSAEQIRELADVVATAVPGRFELAQLARRGGRQRGRLAGRPAACSSSTCSPARSARRAAPAPTAGTSSSPSRPRPRTRTARWNELTWPASTRSPTTRCRSCCRTS